MTKPRRRRRKIDPDLAKLTEKEWQTRIDRKAAELGALTCHVRRATVANGRWITPTSDGGFPDLWCLFPTGRLVVFECKRETAGPSAVEARQREWISRLQKVAGVDAYVVRPSDWPYVETLLNEAAENPQPQLVN